MVNTFLNFLGGFSTTFLIIAILLIIMLIIALIMTVFFEKRLINALKRSKIEEKTRFEREIAELKKSSESPENKFALIDKSARSFLSEKYKINKDMDYSEIIKHFAKKDKSIEGFSKKMIEGIYSGKKMDERKVKLLLNELEHIVQHRGAKVHKDVKIPKFRLYEEGKSIISKLPFIKRKEIKSTKKKPAPKEEKISESKNNEKTLEEQAKEMKLAEKREYHRQLMNSKALAMIEKLNLQKSVLQRAFDEGYLKKQVYDSSLQNIDTVMRKLKEKYL